MLIIKALIKWLFSKKTLSAVLFGLKVANELYGTAKNQEVAEKLKIAQETVDTVAAITGNKDVEKMANSITANEGVFSGFSAHYVEDRHGKGNHGIVLSYEKDGISVKYDPTNGSFGASFSLNI